MLKAVGADCDEPVTKADLANLRSDLYRAMIIQGGAIVALIAGLKLIP